MSQDTRKTFAFIVSLIWTRRRFFVIHQVLTGLLVRVIEVGVYYKNSLVHGNKAKLKNLESHFGPQ